jgi:hypothetical protein
MTKMAMKIQNKTWAIPAAVPAIPPKPKIAAITAITRNTTAHDNMLKSSSSPGI